MTVPEFIFRTLKWIMPALIIAAPALSLNAPARNESPVTIDILSKHLRLLKEKNSVPISFRFGRNTVIRSHIDGTDRRISSMTVRYENGYRIQCDGTDIPPQSGYTISSDTDDTFSVTVHGETKSREYPMPLVITDDGTCPSFVITEDMTRYAYDSAAAEFGDFRDSDAEAVYSAAILIYTRVLQPHGKPLHKYSALCDLTHCQIYRGRTSLFHGDRIPWIVDPHSAPDGVYFHACCGGKTFTAGIFSGAGVNDVTGITDRFTCDGTWLCADSSSAWSRDISLDEIGKILIGNIISPSDIPTDLVVNSLYGTVTVTCGDKSKRYSSEDFRLRINRIKGWSFIRSNNYSVTHEHGGIIHFSGRGLGHGVGLCQSGALSLAKRGFSRYEIIMHYYPDIKFTTNGSDHVPPHLSYCLFNLFGDASTRPSYTSFLSRRVPAGSIFKLFVACYLYSRRPDLAEGYSFRCEGRSSDSDMPERCSKSEGHGTVTLAEALPRSCNLYFASLSQYIDRDDFYAFTEKLSKKLGISIRIPDTHNAKEFTRLLSGLDFNTTVTVADLVIISRFLYSGTGTNEYSRRFEALVSVDSRRKIIEHLGNTFINGTASEKIPAYGEKVIKTDIHEEDTPSSDRNHLLMWGKTSTFIHGSNKPVSYGAFAGGAGENGIVVLLRSGNGNLAARWGEKILSDMVRP